MACPRILIRMGLRSSVGKNLNLASNCDSNVLPLHGTEFPQKRADRRKESRALKGKLPKWRQSLALSEQSELQESQIPGTMSHCWVWAQVEGSRGHAGYQQMGSKRALICCSLEQRNHRTAHPRTESVRWSGNSSKLCVRPSWTWRKLQAVRKAGVPTEQCSEHWFPPTTSS